MGFAQKVPGDIVIDLATMVNATIKLGGGLRQVWKLQLNLNIWYFVVVVDCIVI